MVPLCATKHTDNFQARESAINVTESSKRLDADWPLTSPIGSFARKQGDFARENRSRLEIVYRRDFFSPDDFYLLRYHYHEKVFPPLAYVRDALVEMPFFALPVFSSIKITFSNRDAREKIRSDKTLVDFR